MAVGLTDSDVYNQVNKGNTTFEKEYKEVAEKMKMLLCNMWNGLSMGHKVTEEEYAVISLREHKAILQALEQHNEALARQRMHEHIIRSMENMLTRYLPDPAP